MPQIAAEDPRQDAHLRVIVQRDLLVGPEADDADGVLVGDLGYVEVAHEGPQRHAPEGALGRVPDSVAAPR